jgi:hypothetical protein
MLERLKSGVCQDHRRGPARTPGGDHGGRTSPEARTGAQGDERWDEILRVQELTLNLRSNKVTPDELFRHVVDGAADSLGADEASLMLVEGDDLSRFPNLVPKGGRIQSAVSVPLEVGGRVVLEIPQRRPGA